MKTAASRKAAIEDGPTIVRGPAIVEVPAQAGPFGLASSLKRPPVKRVYAAPLDPATVEIKRGAPIPEPQRGTAPVYKTLWDRMKPGDCVDLDERQAQGMVAHIKTIGGKCAARKLPNGKRGVWRLA